MSRLPKTLAEVISNVRPKRTIYELRHLVLGITLPPYTYKLLVEQL